MLIQFTVGNFRSFRDKVTLSLEATGDDWREDDNLILKTEPRLVKAAAIYGPNAGGKSNLLKAMVQFRELVKESSKDSQAGESISVTPFRLNKSNLEAPSFFEGVLLRNGIRYRYGFEVTADEIVSEWLFKQADSIRETRLFTREQGVIQATDAFKEGKGLEERTRKNALFLSVAAQFNGEIAGEIITWMKQFRDISGLDDTNYLNFTANRLNDPYYGPLIHDMVKQADIGIEKLEREEISAEQLAKLLPEKWSAQQRETLLRRFEGGFAVKVLHRGYDARDQPSELVSFDFGTDESEGTKKYVALTGPFLHTLHEGSILIVDELEARLHPLLTKALVGLFNSSANRKNAQLVFATHDESLLDSQRIRRDQVWFVEKDDMQASRLYSLHEIKGVRKEAKFAKEYLMGQFGGVPRVGDLESTINQDCE